MLLADPAIFRFPETFFNNWTEDVTTGSKAEKNSKQLIASKNSFFAVSDKVLNTPLGKEPKKKGIS